MADFRVAVAKFRVPASLTTQDITVPGFGTPKAALFMINQSYTTTSSDSDITIKRTTASWSIGASDGVREWYVAGSSRTAQSRASTWRAGDNDGCICMINEGGTIWQRCSGLTAGGNGPIADGWRIEVTAQSTGAERFGLCVLFGGDDLSAHADLTPALGTLGQTTNIVAPSFEADFAFLATPGDTMTSSTPLSHLIAVYGACVPGISDHAVGFSDVNNEQPTDAGAYAANTRCIGQYHQATWSWGTSSGANPAGFDLTVEDGNSLGDVAGYLALKADGADFHVSTIDAPASAAVPWNVNSIGFEPNAVVLLETPCGAVNTPTAGLAIGLAAFDGTRTRTLASSSENAANPTNTASIGAEKVAYLMDQTNAGILHDIGWSDPGTTFHANGFMIHNNDIIAASAANKWLCLAFGDGGEVPSRGALPVIRQQYERHLK